jgi:hypothetical protein
MIDSRFAPVRRATAQKLPLGTVGVTDGDGLTTVGLPDVSDSDGLGEGGSVGV